MVHDNEKNLQMQDLQTIWKLTIDPETFCIDFCQMNDLVFIKDTLHITESYKVII